MTKAKQQNNHARSKRKRKMLRMKNRQRSISLKRADKIIKAQREKGQTFRSYLSTNGKLIKAKHVAILTEYSDSGHKRALNQRQKRKRWRQNPHTRKKR